MDESKEILEEILEKVAKAQHINNCETHIEPYCTVEATYTSYMYRVTLKPPGKDELKLFAKVAAPDDTLRAIVPFLEIEYFFYDDLLRKYQQLEEKHNVLVEHRVVTAKLYFVSLEPLKETLILEDLTAKAFAIHDKFKSIDWEFASKSLENIAKFHALSVALSEDDPEDFQNLTIVQRNIDFGGMDYFVEIVFKAALGVVKEENKNSVQKYFTDLINSHDDMKYNRAYRRPFIIHGDYSPKNIMYRIVNGSMEVIAIDYRMMYLGSPVVDLMLLIFVGSDKKFRDQYFEQCLDYYYGELSNALKRLGLESDTLYSKEDFDYEVKQLMPVGLVQNLIFLFKLTCQEDADSENEDISSDDFAVGTYGLYTEKINEIIDEFIERGYI